MDSKHRFGKICSARRRELGLTQNDLAAAVGLSGAMISLIERGGASTTLDRMDSIADALGIEVVIAVTEEEQDPLVHLMQQSAADLDPMLRETIMNLVRVAVTQKRNAG